MIVKDYRKKTVFKGMTLKDLLHWCQKEGLPSFRGKQIYEWLYKHGINSVNNMSNLSNELRAKMDDIGVFQTLQLEKIESSEIEKTKKILFKTIDNHFIESVSMIEKDRHTICISSQIGCNVDCDFCATASMGLIRNLMSGEIIDQAIAIRNLVSNPISNVVFMGMGEPFLNYKQVIKAAEILSNDLGFGLSPKRITISTSGIVPKINQFIKDKHKYKLAISLNATDDETRKKIMPINRNWPINKVMESATAFAKKSSHRIMFEYVLLKDINDSSEDAIRLTKLIKNINCKINIIPYNETNGKYKRPSESKIENFIRILNKKRKNFTILVRWSKGEDISAACGQLAVNN